MNLHLFPTYRILTSLQHLNLDSFLAFFLLLLYNDFILISNHERTYPMNKTKRITAIIGIVLLVAIYLLTLISAIFGSKYTNGLFFSSLFASFFVPVTIYAIMLIYRLVHKTKDVFSPNSTGEKEEDITEDK